MCFRDCIVGESMWVDICVCARVRICVCVNVGTCVSSTGLVLTASSAWRVSAVSAVCLVSDRPRILNTRVGVCFAYLLGDRAPVFLLIWSSLAQ